MQAVDPDPTTASTRTGFSAYPSSGVQVSYQSAFALAAFCLTGDRNRCDVHGGVLFAVKLNMRLAESCVMQGHVTVLVAVKHLVLKHQLMLL